MLDDTQHLSIDAPNAILRVEDLARIAGIPYFGKNGPVRVSFRVGLGHQKRSETSYMLDVRLIAPGNRSQRAYDALEVMANELSSHDARTTLSNARIHDLVPKRETPDREDIRNMNRSDRFAYELHVQVAEKLRKQPEVVKSLALRNLQRFRDQQAGRNLSLQTWEQLLSLSTEQLIASILDNGIRGQWLRSSTIFFGVLSEDERKAVLRLLTPIARK
jgi:hypothetical protein